MSAPNYPDFPAAAIGWLRGQSSIVSAFSEDTTQTGGTKFWADEAQGQPSLPWCVYEELESRETYMTAARGVTNVLEEATVRFVVVAGGKKQARDLGRMIAKGLTDAPLVFADGTLMNLRPITEGWAKTGDVAPGSPVSYVRVVVFEVMIQRTT